MTNENSNKNSWGISSKSAMSYERGNDIAPTIPLPKHNYFDILGQDNLALQSSSISSPALNLSANRVLPPVPHIPTNLELNADVILPSVTSPIPLNISTPNVSMISDNFLINTPKVSASNSGRNELSIQCLKRFLYHHLIYIVLYYF